MSCIKGLGSKGKIPSVRFEPPDAFKSMPHENLGSRDPFGMFRCIEKKLADIAQIAPKFRSIIPASHRQGNCIGIN